MLTICALTAVRRRRQPRVCCVPCAVCRLPPPSLPTAQRTASWAQVNRVGELKLSLEERERSLNITRAQLKAVRREAEVERTAQEEKAKFEAHRPLRYEASALSPRRGRPDVVSHHDPSMRFDGTGSTA